MLTLLTNLNSFICYLLNDYSKDEITRLSRLSNYAEELILTIFVVKSKNKERIISYFVLYIKVQTPFCNIIYIHF